MSEDQHSREYWDQRYGTADRIWSGNPNSQLVRYVSGRAAATALEVGAGEGADAVWLAGQGWQVTAVEVSPVALARAARYAEKAGVTGRITWEQADVRNWSPAPRRFDLVSVQFLHLPIETFGPLLTRLAECVLPAGLLLVVAHDISELHHPGYHGPGGHGPSDHEHGPEFFVPAEQLAGLLDPGQWDVTLTTHDRTMATDQGQETGVRDSVLHAVRRS